MEWGGVWREQQFDVVVLVCVQGDSVPFDEFSF
jgi:hypothetical protein